MDSNIVGQIEASEGKSSILKISLVRLMCLVVSSIYSLCIDPLHLYHRAHFLDVLVKKLPEHLAHLGKLLVSYAQDNASGLVELTFSDGTKDNCDILVGCDGIRSTVRRHMFEQFSNKGNTDMLKYVEPMWTGEVLYRALIPSDRLPLKNGEKHQVLRRPTMVNNNLTS
jgi:salicylate hydroxylase